MRTVSIQLGTMQLPHRLPFSSHSKALRLKSEKTRFTVYTALMEKTFLVIKKKIMSPSSRPIMSVFKSPSFSSPNRITVVGRYLQRSSRANPLLKQVPYRRLYRKVSRRIQSISREGDPTTSLGSLLRYSAILKVKNFLLMFS